MNNYPDPWFAYQQFTKKHGYDLSYSDFSNQYWDQYYNSLFTGGGGGFSSYGGGGNYSMTFTWYTLEDNPRNKVDYERSELTIYPSIKVEHSATMQMSLENDSYNNLGVYNNQGGFTSGFIHPNTTTSETTPSMIIAGQGLIIEVARRASISEAAAAKTTSALKTALSTAKYAKYAGKALGGVGAIAIGFESAFDSNGFTLGDAAKVGVGVATLFTPFGWVYGLADLGTFIFTGTSFSDRIGSGIDKSLKVNKVPK